MTRPSCPYCGEEAVLTTGAVIYPRLAHLHANTMYSCLPCGAWVGCHEGTTRPLGRLANAELRQAKMATHRVFDRIWKDGPKGARGAAYHWLAGALGISIEDCHIGMFDVAMCRRAIAACEARIHSATPPAKD